MTTDAKDKPRDVVPPEAGGDSKDRVPKDSSPKTYTEEEVELKFSSQRSVLDAKVAKLEKSGEVTTKRAEAAEEALTQDRKERREAELEAAREDPTQFSAVQQRQKREAKEAELAKERRELDAEKEKHQETVKSDLDTIRIFNRTKLAAEVAVDKGVSADALLKLTKEDSREAMEATAKLLSEKKPPLRPDSSKTIGGKDISALTPDELIKEGVRKKLNQ